MLTPGQQTFVEYYARTKCLKTAAVAAGVPINMALAQATQWLGKGEVIKAVQQSQTEQSNNLDEHRRRLLQHTMALATSDVSNVLFEDESGELQLRKLNDMTTEARWAIKKIQITESPVPYSDTPRRKISLEMHSKTDALNNAIKVLGLDNTNITHHFSAREIESMDSVKLDDLMKGLTRAGGDD